MFMPIYKKKITRAGGINMYRKISDGWMKHWDFELIDVIMLEISLFISYFFQTP